MIDLIIPWNFSSFFGSLSAKKLKTRIVEEIGSEDIGDFQVHQKILPQYRFVDLYRAIEHFCSQFEGVATIESDRFEDLNTILHGHLSREIPQLVSKAKYEAWPTGPGEEVSLPSDNFWICRKTRRSTAEFILRLWFNPYIERAILEVASNNPGGAEDAAAAIASRSAEVSIYRNQILEFSSESGVRDEHGDVENPDRFKIRFKAHEPVKDEDIVMDEDIRRILRRNVIDLHLRRDILKKHGVPVRRGVLLYGPPGTGKTFSCRYILSQLPNVTRIIVTGTALYMVRPIFALARMLQPTLLIFEDVDLVFTARHMNFQTSLLGDLLDQMDGIRPYEDVGIILTTNSIDRMEDAITDRPGRISQCVFFGPPGPELRERYLKHYLHPFQPLKVDVKKLVESSNGATQAFLKEWVHRSVQIATERMGSATTSIALEDGDFHAAMNEMKQFSKGTTGKIIGFHEMG